MAVGTIFNSVPSAELFPMPKHLEGFPLCEYCGNEVKQEGYRLDWARFCDETCMSKWIYTKRIYRRKR